MPSAALDPSLRPPIVGFVAVGDPAATRTVYSTIVALVVLGVVLAGLAIWVWRRTRPEPELLAPLETMQTRAWRKLDPAAQRRLLDDSRPDGAVPLRRSTSAPAVDSSFATVAPVASFDDLSDADHPDDEPDDDAAGPNEQVAHEVDEESVAAHAEPDDDSHDDLGDGGGFPAPDPTRASAVDSGDADETGEIVEEDPFASIASDDDSEGPDDATVEAERSAAVADDDDDVDLDDDVDDDHEGEDGSSPRRRAIDPLLMPTRPDSSN